MSVVRRVVVDLGAIACWLVVWLISVWVSVEVVRWVLLSPSPEEHAVYRLAVLFVGVLLLSPMGFACSSFFLWVNRRVPLFIACAVLVGLVAALWPFLAPRG